MSYIKNKIDWCLKKAERELEKGEKHRGIIEIKSDLEKAREYIEKAEHYLKATEYLKKGNFSDISASTIFYSIYHCFLAIITKFGFESKNQECTLALMYSLIEDGKIDFKEEMLEKIASFHTEKDMEQTSLGIREKYQYGTNLSIKENLYQELLDLAKEVISITKEEIEK